MNYYHTGSGIQKNVRGITIIELLIVLILFSVVMAGLYSAYTVQLKQAMTEYKLSQSEMEFQIGKNILERDLAMVGFGMADDYTGFQNPPNNIIKPLEATNGGGAEDTLTLRGTGLGRGSRASQAWTYTVSSTPSTTAGFKEWTVDVSGAQVRDARETPVVGDRIVYIEPNLKKILYMDSTQGQVVNGDTQKYWLFPYVGTSTQSPYPNPMDVGVVAYGLHTAPTSTLGNADFPYYEVIYSLSTGTVAYCAPDTKTLMRVEKKKTAGEVPQPLMNCVLDFQVAFGLDTNEDGSIDCWDNGGAVEMAGYTLAALKARLKQIKAYVLLQQGARDSKYRYIGTETGLNENQILIGDPQLTACGGGVVGRTVTLTEDQRQYRWKVIRISASPRNIR